jgi:hypothetical protein
MKKCDYCGKEISYMEQYCCEDCQRKTIKYYDFQEKYTKLFSVINCICIFAIPIGIFVFPMVNALGFSITAFALVILGAMIFALPFPTEDMIRKFKLKKAVKICKILGIVLFAIGVVLTIIDFILFL